MKDFVCQIHSHTDIGSGRLYPGDFIDIGCDPGQSNALILDPTIRHDATMNTVIEGIGILDINFVIPSIVIGIDQMGSDKFA